MRTVTVVVWTRQGTKVTGARETMPEETLNNLMQQVASLRTLSTLMLLDSRGVTHFVHPDAVEQVEVHHSEASADEIRKAEERIKAQQVKERLTIARTVPTNHQDPRSN
jgi:hypothetical protein